MPAKPPAGRNRPTFTDQEALQFHSVGRPGKLEVVATKPMVRPVARSFASRARSEAIVLNSSMAQSNE